MWIDVSDAGYGVSLINDSKCGFDVDGATMRLSAIRSPIYAFHDPRQVEEGKRYSYMDQGMQSFAFTLLPHSGTWQDAHTVQEAAMMNMPPPAVEVARHGSEWLGERSFGWIKAPTVDLCAIKEAEDDDSLICRFYETAGSDPVETKLILEGAKYPVKIGPFKLKTVRISKGAAADVDLVERG